ncbi:dnaJ homolog subfamily C member 1 [Contarinia nasturtii]|uniref:dnaJ homolog subfamily C member 1 n=1 Tax=Contarinia nasturtii TaxID=265458 RepID=UPI0012D3DA6A|nr:dnaJ homolog subfamily C member 1 [Contarinia nasturtii]
MKLIGLFGFLTLIALNVANVSAWDQEELEIFDLVEEINQNFYTILKVDQQATSAEIRKAFRSLSVVLHPDKNDAEDANVQFRNLVSVYEVLKDTAKREKYNKVLKDGLPDWRSALYYYRRYRKMGLAEMIGLVFVIFTIGQYIVSWAVYAEKKYTAESLFGSKLRKLQKKNKSAVNIDELLNQIPTPSIKNTLPFQIVRGVWNTPRAIKDFFTDMHDYKQQILEEKRREAEEAEQQRQLEEEFARAKEAKKEGMRKRKPVFTAKEKTDEELKGYAQLNVDMAKGKVKAVETKAPVLSGGFWTDDDLNELTRLTKKYPNGTLSRWDVIAEHMNRSVQEVTFMAAKMKEPSYRQTDSVAESIVQEATKKVKKVAGDVKTAPAEVVWTQEQQKLLETAIVKYPKTTAGDRWQKIANTVPGKTKEECLARYKYLVQKLKEQKQKEAENEEKVQKSEDNEVDRVENVENSEKDAEPEPEPEPELVEEEEEPFVAKKTGGKPRNKRKERKKRMDFSSDEEDNLDYE